MAVPTSSEKTILMNCPLPVNYNVNCRAPSRLSAQMQQFVSKRSDCREALKPVQPCVSCPGGRLRFSTRHLVAKCKSHVYIIQHSGRVAISGRQTGRTWWRSVLNVACRPVVQVWTWLNEDHALKLTSLDAKSLRLRSAESG